MIEGPWGEPRIYPDMQGILDNPDAAYAKLKEMGKGLFGPNGARARAALGGLLGGGQQGGTGRRRTAKAQAGGKPGDLLGGQLGETIGNLLQQGLSGGLGQSGRGAISGTSQGAARPSSARSIPRGRAAAQPARRQRPRHRRPQSACRAAGQPADERRAAAAVQPLTAETRIPLLADPSLPGRRPRERYPRLKSG